MYNLPETLWRTQNGSLYPRLSGDSPSAVLGTMPRRCRWRGRSKQTSCFTIDSWSHDRLTSCLSAYLLIILTWSQHLATRKFLRKKTLYANALLHDMTYARGIQENMPLAWIGDMPLILLSSNMTACTQSFKSTCLRESSGVFPARHQFWQKLFWW